MLNRADVTRHIKMLNDNFAFAIQRAEQILDEVKQGRSKNHAAHNLSSTAQEMAVLAGQIEALEMIESSMTPDPSLTREGLEESL